MISYELAKELKEAGFPQNRKGHYRCGDCDCSPCLKHKFGGETYYDVPTLSELMEACEGKELSISRSYYENKGCWTASLLTEDTTMKKQKSFMVSGTNAEDAAARLWLALNKK